MVRTAWHRALPYSGPGELEDKAPRTNMPKIMPLLQRHAVRTPPLKCPRRHSGGGQENDRNPELNGSMVEDLAKSLTSLHWPSRVLYVVPRIRREDRTEAFLRCRNRCRLSSAAERESASSLGKRSVQGSS